MIHALCLLFQGVFSKLQGEKRKIARFNFCSIEKDGEKCAAFVEKELQAGVRGIRADKKEVPSGKCLFCGKTAGEVVYAGKSY